MIRNVMWDIFPPPDPRNQEKKWEFILNQSWFPLYYMKHHVNTLKESSKADQWVVKNFLW